MTTKNQNNIVGSTLKVTASDCLDLYLENMEDTKDHKSIAELLNDQEENNKINNSKKNQEENTQNS